MPDSDFVFEKGEEVHHGSPVDNDFVRERGELLSDHRTSNLSFIRGRGLGAPSEILHFIFGKNEFSAWHSDIEANFGIGVRAEYSNDTTLNEEIDTSQAVVIVSIGDVEDPRMPESAELSALGDYWDTRGRVVVMSEDNRENYGPRMDVANDFIEACVGVRPHDGADDKDNYGCYTPPYVPENEHTVFNGVVEIGRRVDEALITTSSPPVYPVYSHSNNCWGYVDNDEGRMWIDGGHHTFDGKTPEYGDCLDNDKYGEQMIDWLLS